MTDRRIEGLLAELAMQVPEMAPALARIQLEPATPEQIMAATSGRGFLAFVRFDGSGMIAHQLLEDPHFAKFVLGHEALHLVLERVARIEHLAGPEWDGDYNRANMAADRWINQILADLDVATADQMRRWGVLLPASGQEEADIMTIWRAEEKQKQKGPGNSKKGPGQGCSPEGEEGEGSGQGDDGGLSDQEAHSVAAGLGTRSPGVRKMTAPPPPSVRWQDALHEAAAAAGGVGLSARPRVTRAKLGRRSTADIPKAGKSSRRPQIVVVVDVSGSMSGLLDAVVAECEDLDKRAGVHLVLHDSQVLYSGPYKRGREKITPCGGTDFTPAIEESEKAARAWPGKSVVVHLTDGYPCGAWPDVPRAFAAGFAGIFVPGVTAPGSWRTRRCKK